MGRHKNYRLFSQQEQNGMIVSEIAYGGVTYTLCSQFSQEQNAPSQKDICYELAMHNLKYMQHLESVRENPIIETQAI